MKPCSLLALSLLTFACASPGTRIAAAEGGWVSTDDGAFSLYFPPGALDADLEVSIERLPEDRWEVGGPRRFTRIGDVYRVTPSMPLSRDVYAVVALDAVPDVLRAPSGDPVLAVHYVWNGDKVRPAPYTRTVYLADGRVALVGTLFDLGDHWFGERAPGEGNSLVQVSAHLEADGGPHAPDAAWALSRGGLFTDLPLAVLGSDVTVAAISDGDATVAAMAEGGTDGAWADLLGLRPFELFGGTAPRVESVASVEEPMPFEVDEFTPRDPLRDPLPGWRCAGASAAEATLFGGVDVVTGASSGTLTAGIVVELGRASCP